MLNNNYQVNKLYAANVNTSKAILKIKMLSRQRNKSFEIANLDSGNINGYSK